MSGLDEVVFHAQQNDLKQEEERLAKEKAEKAAWLAKAKAPGTYNISQLLEKMYGGGAEGAPQQLNAPAPVKQPEERKTLDARFPPPPTSKPTG